MMFRKWSPEEKPREKFLQKGAQALTMTELLAILLRTGYLGKSVVELAQDVVNSLIGGSGDLASITPEKLMQIKGIGPDKAVTLCAAVELSKRLQEYRAKETFADFSQPKAVASYMMPRVRALKEEHVYAAFLDVKNGLIKLEVISKGGLQTSLLEQRIVFRKGIESNAASFILVHNHPSGHAEVSAEDVAVTRTFLKAGSIMGIPLLDHIVIGDGTYTSLREAGYF